MGGLGFLLVAGILEGLVYIGLGAALGPVFSIMASMTFTWLLNRTLTFASPSQPNWGEFASYVLSSLIGLLTNYGVYALAVVATSHSLRARPAHVSRPGFAPSMGPTGAMTA